MKTTVSLTQLELCPTVQFPEIAVSYLVGAIAYRGFTESLPVYPVLKDTGPMTFLVLDGTARVMALRQLRWEPRINVVVMKPSTLHGMLQYVYGIQATQPFDELVFKARFRKGEPVAAIAEELQVASCLLEYLNLIE